MFGGEAGGVGEFEGIMKLKDLIVFWGAVIFTVGVCIILFFAALGGLLGWEFNLAILGLV